MNEIMTPQELEEKSACRPGIRLAEKLLGKGWEEAAITREFVIGMLMHLRAREYYGWVVRKYRDTPTLEGQDLSGVELSRGVFNYTNCVAAKFSNSNLDYSVFGSAYMDYAEFVGASAFRGDFDLVGAYCADFRDAWLHYATFRGANLKGADFRGAQLNNASFRSACLGNTKWEGAHFENTDFQDAYIDEETKEVLLKMGAEV